MTKDLESACCDLFSLRACALLRRLGGGMAGSDVWLVTYADRAPGELRIGILKVTPADKRDDFDRELAGSAAAARSWLSDFAAATPAGAVHDGSRLMLARLALPANDRRSNDALHDVIAAEGASSVVLEAAAAVAERYVREISTRLVDEPTWAKDDVSGMVHRLLLRWAPGIRGLDWTWWNYPGPSDRTFIDGDVVHVNPVWAASDPAAWRDEGTMLPWGFQHGDLNARNVLVLDRDPTSDRCPPQIRFIDWEKAGEASMFLDLCWLSIWVLMATADGHVAIESPAWEDAPGAFVDRVLGRGKAPVAGGFAPAMRLIDEIWDTVWRGLSGRVADEETIRASVALTLGACCLAKAYYEVRDLDSLRTATKRWNRRTVRWAACFFRASALAWERSHLLAPHGEAARSLSFADARPLLDPPTMDAIDRVFEGQWGVDDVVSISDAVCRGGAGNGPHALIAAAAARIRRSIPERGPVARDLVDRMWRIFEGRSIADPALRWMANLIPPERLDTIPGIGVRERFMLLTCGLDQANHRGHGPDDVPYWSMLQQMRDAAQVAPHLLLEADLRSAVCHANIFDFAGALRHLATRWPDPGALCAFPGMLREAGRLMSSLGQYEAFLGRHEAADRHFVAALDILGRIEEPETRSFETRKTSTYRAFNLLGHDNHRADRVIEEILRTHVGVELADAGTRFAPDADAALVFLHHLYLRRASLPGVDAREYLSHRAAWRTAHHHPWELIELARGLLLRDTDPAEAGRRVQRAAEWCLDEHAVLGTIGTVIVAVARCAGILDHGPLADRALGRAALERRRGRLRFDFDAVIEGLCAPAASRVDGILALLPFNYR